MTVTILGIDENNTPADIILSWVAPAEREDNTALSLSAIAGYKVYYGTTQGQCPNSIAINDGTLRVILLPAYLPAPTISL